MIDKNQQKKIECIAAMISKANDMLFSLLGELDAERDFHRFHLLHFVQPPSKEEEEK